jgi:hypothetical protein
MKTWGTESGAPFTFSSRGVRRGGRRGICCSRLWNGMERKSPSLRYAQGWGTRKSFRSTGTLACAQLGFVAAAEKAHSQEWLCYSKRAETSLPAGRRAPPLQNQSVFAARKRISTTPIGDWRSQELLRSFLRRLNWRAGLQQIHGFVEG